MIMTSERSFDRPGFNPGFAASNRSTVPLDNSQVLLIDDEAVVREIGTEMLESMGISCITAENGEEGIRIYKESSSDIGAVILDIEMPGLSGNQVYDILKQINPEIKILITSGYAQAHLETKYFKRKLDHFMPKPFQMKQLLLKLGNLIKP